MSEDKVQSMGQSPDEGDASDPTGVDSADTVDEETIQKRILDRLESQGFPHAYVSADGQFKTGSEYDEDNSHVSGDQGDFILGVRNDSLTAMADDGDYHPLMIDSDGSLVITENDALTVTDDGNLSLSSSIGTNIGTVDIQNLQLQDGGGILGFVQRRGSSIKTSIEQHQLTGSNPLPTEQQTPVKLEESAAAGGNVVDPSTSDPEFVVSSAHGVEDKGVAVLAVRDDKSNQSFTDADLDHTPIGTTEEGRIHTNVPRRSTSGSAAVSPSFNSDDGSDIELSRKEPFSTVMVSALNEDTGDDVKSVDFRVRESPLPIADIPSAMSEDDAFHLLDRTDGVGEAVTYKQRFDVTGRSIQFQFQDSSITSPSGSVSFMIIAV